MLRDAGLALRDRRPGRPSHRQNPRHEHEVTAEASRRRLTGCAGANKPDGYGSSAIIFIYSSCVQARTVRVRTFPCAPRASANLAMLSPLGDSMKTTRSLSPEVR